MSDAFKEVIFLVSVTSICGELELNFCKYENCGWYFELLELKMLWIRFCNKFETFLMTWVLTRIFDMLPILSPIKKICHEWNRTSVFYLWLDISDSTIFWRGREGGSYKTMNLQNVGSTSKIPDTESIYVYITKSVPKKLQKLKKIQLT